MNTVVVITIPLVAYHDTIYWGLYEEHTGKVRNHLLCHPTAGKQISFAFKRAIEKNAKIILVADDKFNLEKKTNDDPLESDLVPFLVEYPLPKSWSEYTDRFIAPPEEFYLTQFSFSEKKLLKNSKHEFGLSGDCANEWTKLLEWLENEGYEKVEAYIPKACSKGICYATPYAKESGIYTKPLEIFFTSGSKIDSCI